MHQDILERLSSLEKITSIKINPNTWGELGLVTIRFNQEYYPEDVYPDKTIWDTDFEKMFLQAIKDIRCLVDTLEGVEDSHDS